MGVCKFSYSIRDNEKKIGIFRSLGIPTRCVDRIFLQESLIITALSEAFASVVALGILHGVNRHLASARFDAENLRFLTPTLWVWLLCLLLLLLFGCLVVAVPLRKMHRKSIVELLLEE